MKRPLLLLFFFGLYFGVLTEKANAQTFLIHYWNFNDNSSQSAILTPSFSLTGSPSIIHQAGGISAIDFAGGTGQNFNVANVNARNSDVSGTHLRFNDPIGGGLVFSLPTTGYKNVVIKYATRRSGSGAGTQVIEFSTDGSVFSLFGEITPVNGDPELATLDFSAIASVNDNANFKIRITFQQGGGGIVGNNRFDNFAVDGTSLSSDTSPPTVSNFAIPSLTDLEVVFSESITITSATTISNYTLAPSGNISSILYDDATKKATLTVSGLTDGTAYTLTVNGVSDLALNTMTTQAVSPVLIFNSSTPPLIITEIMYNALNVSEADALEFIEIYNNGASIVQAGGLKIKDGNNFDYILPSTEIPANGFLLLATDKTGAELFYSTQTFIDLPATGNALGNGGELIQLRNSLNTIIDEVNYDDASPWPLDADEKGYSLELFKLSLDNSLGQNWGVPSMLVKQLNGVNIYATPGAFAATPSPVSFATDKTNVSENSGALLISVNIAFSSSNEVSTLVTVAGGNAVAGTDYTFADQTITFSANSTTAQNVSLEILENTTATQDKYVVLQLGTVTNGKLGSIKQHIIFIKDNDRTPITPSNALNITFTGNFKVAEAGSSAEISAYDPTSKRLFVMNSLKNKMEILNLSNPAAITSITTIDMAPYGAGLNSIAVKNGIVAIAVENTTTTNGKVAFFNTDGIHQKSVEAGNLPDMITFSPDGKYVLTANEAQPIFYTPTLSDPEGSVTIVDISGGIANLTQSNVTQVNFNAFDSQMGALKTQGVRIFGPGATVSQDLEPEYIAVSADSKKAWVTLQENNAIAFVNLETKTVTDIKPLGYKDHTLAENSFDASDVSGDIFFGTWKVKGMYMPDAIAAYEVAGVPYVITANEGDAREYTGITDEVTLASLNLDPTAFPDATILKNNSALGRLAVTNKTGDTDSDGDFDEIYSYGARSFTIWNGNTAAKVFDSGNQLERITAEDATWGSFFNSNNSIGNPGKKNRSDNKGPEPEGVAVAFINGRQYAFIALERIGGVITYDVTNPSSPVFVGYDNNRSNPTIATDDFGSEGIVYISAKESPTGTALIVLSNEVSGTVSVYTIDGILNVDAPVATAATDLTGISFTANWNAVSGATAYRLDVSEDNFATYVTGFENKQVTGISTEVVGLDDGRTYQYRVRAVEGINISDHSNVIDIIITGAEKNADKLLFDVYPNPANDILNFSRPADFELFTIQGLRLKQGRSSSVEISDLADGLYIIKDKQGRSAKIVIKR